MSIKCVCVIEHSELCQCLIVSVCDWYTIKSAKTTFTLPRNMKNKSIHSSHSDML